MTSIQTNTLDLAAAYLAKNPDLKGENKKIQTITFNTPNGIEELRVLKGTFDLKGRIKTLETAKAELAKSKTTKHRCLCALAALLTVAAVAGLVAAAILGNVATIITLSVALFLLGYTQPYRKGLNFDYAGVLFAPFGVPWFVYDMLTYEKGAKSKVKECEQSTNQLSMYIVEKAPEIQQWLDKVIEQYDCQGSIDIDLKMLKKLEIALRNVDRAKKLQQNLQEAKQLMITV